MNKIKTLATQICTITALLFAFMAHDWMTIGYGLNPFVAIPIGVLLIAAPYTRLADW